MSATDELEHYMTACSGLRAENARLQTALTEAEIHLKTARWVLEMDDPRLLKALQTIERLIAERDGYKALAERRKEALEVLEWLPEDDGEWAECPCCGSAKLNGHIPDGCQLRAAIEEEGK